MGGGVSINLCKIRHGSLDLDVESTSNEHWIVVTGTGHDTLITNCLFATGLDIGCTLHVVTCICTLQVPVSVDAHNVNTSLFINILKYWGNNHQMQSESVIGGVAKKAFARINTAISITMASYVSNILSQYMPRTRVVLVSIVVFVFFIMLQR